MKTRVRKWGNSLALRIPRALADEARLAEDTPVELTVVEGGVVVRLLAKRPPTLGELLSGVTEDNLHGEWDTGPAVGGEIW